MVASLALGTPVAHASPPECTSGSPTTWTYAGDAAQQCVTPGTPGSVRQVSLRVDHIFGGGGGAGQHDPNYAPGGGSGKISFDLSVPEATTLDLYVAGGGIYSDKAPDYRGAGASGGGSSAIVSAGLPLAEAGGGGGGTNLVEGGDGARTGANGDGACAGAGGNVGQTGSGGAGGPVAGGCTGASPYPVVGGAGGSGWNGDGGAGGSAVGYATVTGTGGFGWSTGGDAGGGPEDDIATAGSGGGGGYGDGGGGAALDVAAEEATGSGGGGGSKVRATAGTNATYTTEATGQEEDDGLPGEIQFSTVGPAVVTEASAPTGVTTTAAASHSTVDANSDLPVTEITIEYSLDPDFESGVLSVPGDPASLPGVVAEVPVAAALSGLKPGTTYFYRVRASNGELTTLGAVAQFTTATPPAVPPTVTGISPGKGTTRGGTKVTITGTGFRSGATATVGGVACRPVTVVTSTTLTCRTGAHAKGLVDVVVTNPDQLSGRGTDLFRYVAPSPPQPPPGPSLTVSAKPRGAVAVERPTRVVRKVTGDGRITVKAKCTVHGHRVGKACRIRIGDSRHRVVVTPRCNDGVRIHVRITARSHGRTEVWRRSWRVDPAPVVMCRSGGNG